MKVLSDNKKIRFDYFVIETFEAGMVLTGGEVKSIRMGRLNLAGSYVVLKNEEAFLVGANIPPYQPGNTPADYNPKRDRKLLLKKKEIRYLIGKTKEKGLTLAPLRVYTGNALIKLELALVRGKKKKDKRESIKKKDMERETGRKFKA